jgi:16S rRNA (guanine527-N7)-methyltransferase
MRRGALVGFHVKQFWVVDRDRLEAVCPGLSEGQRGQMAVYVEMLGREAVPLGLVGFGVEGIVEQVGRSLVLLKALGAVEELVDVGSGAGLPGVALGIVLGRGTLVEPDRRAAGFLERVVRETGASIQVLVGSAEEVGAGPLRETFDGVVARALAPLGVAAELCAPLCAVRGKVVVTAGEGAGVGISEGALARLGLGAPEVEVLEGALDISQRVHMMGKISPTSGEFPRRVGVARRRPIV